MKKYIFSEFYIELTRRCNKKCTHCVRGDAQNLTITREIIDKLFADTEECIQVYITGGEPLLESDILIYLIDKIAKNWNTVHLSMTTNGSVLNKEVVKAFEDFCKTPTKNESLKRKAKLAISCDAYHTAGDCQNAYEFYRPLFDEANRRLGCGEDNPQMMLKQYSPISQEDGKNIAEIGESILIYAGRGIELANKGSGFEFGKNIMVPNTNYHRLKIAGGVVYCTVYISANGNVILAAEDDSYAKYDSCHSGNLLNENLNDIITRHQDNCLITCNETNYLNDMRERKLYFEHADNTELDRAVTIKRALLYEINSSVLKIRQMLKETYPILPAQDLIGELPMVLSEENLDALCLRVIGNTHWSIKQRLKNKVDDLEIQYAYLRDLGAHPEGIRIYCSAIVYMQENGLSLMMKLRKREMQILIDKAKSYSSGEREPNNDGVFACGESAVFANANDISEEYRNDRQKADLDRAVDECSYLRSID